MLVLAALGSASASAANPEATLAHRYAPVLRIPTYRGPCGEGEPYLPIDVDLLFGSPTVALRGPWGGGDLVAIGPTAKQLSKGLYAYHLDFPGTALAPGCSYVDWQRRLTADTRPTVYAHVVTDPAHPGEVALQYWFFYVFNEWNNLHEGDWEMVQLVFAAPTAAAALAHPPTEIGYSQHEGAERAAWDSHKLELLDGTHPVVHPAAGSHANFYGEALYLGASASEGVGCDDTRGPTFDVRPRVDVVPTARQQQMRDYPWLAFEGRWGEQHPAFFNGPTGPNLKAQWTEPIVWTDGWRSRSYTVPAGSAFGPGATGFFCTAIGSGSRALVRVVRHPFETGLLLVAAALLLAFALSRATWRPTTPLRLAHRRAWGQILAASARMYVSRTPLFVVIGLLSVPLSLAAGTIELLLRRGTGVLGVETAGGSGIVSLAFVAAGTALTLLSLGLVQAATVSALVEIDAQRPVGPLTAYWLAFRKARELAVAVAAAAVVISVLATFVVGLPFAVWIGGLWSLVVPVIELEDVSGLGALRRSSRLVRGRWLKVASLIVLGAALVLAVGPVVGVVLLFTTDAPFWLVDLVTGIVYAVTMPFLALATAYLYFDARIRAAAAATEPRVLPAEIELANPT